MSKFIAHCALSTIIHITNKGDFLKKSDIERLKIKLENLKINTTKNLRATSENIHSLNSLNQSEEAEMGSVMSMAKIDENIFSANRAELSEIEKALKKIENKTFGKCEMCKEEIDIKRLEAKPYARFCIKCREIFENNNKRTKHGF